ncbi:MAG TPA: glycoside hydrolase family 172 protein [Terriglobia bacterium]|nr:glycoside hydrolase family 172 protein [Terriglobia bacterium]
MKSWFCTVLSLLYSQFLVAQIPISSLPQLGNYESERASSYDRSGGNADYRHLKAGETIEIFNEDGPGEIRHIWTTIPPWSEAYNLKKVVLRMYWDGEKQPSVEAPMGDFFGLGLGTYTLFHSALLVVAPDQAMNAYFPMPFRKHGRITVTNEGSKEISDYYWNIDWIRPASLDPTIAYFHAQYRQCTPCKGWYKGNFYNNDFSEARKDPRWFNKSGDGNYVILDATGDGQFVGVTLSVFQNQWGGWNEGDEMIWVDGEKEPRIHGTGGEDYFNGAWGFSKLYSLPLVGLTEFSGWEPGSRFSLYRWHLEAPIRFRKSIKVTIEDGHANLRSDNIYSVAYWYQLEPHEPLPPLPPVERRIPKLVWTGGPGQDPNMK